MNYDVHGEYKLLQSKLYVLCSQFEGQNEDMNTKTFAKNEDHFWVNFSTAWLLEAVVHLDFVLLP